MSKLNFKLVFLVFALMLGGAALQSCNGDDTELKKTQDDLVAAEARVRELQEKVKAGTASLEELKRLDEAVAAQKLLAEIEALNKEVAKLKEQLANLPPPDRGGAKAQELENEIKGKEKELADKNIKWQALKEIVSGPNEDEGGEETVD